MHLHRFFLPNVYLFFTCKDLIRLTLTVGQKVHVGKVYSELVTANILQHKHMKTNIYSNSKSAFFQGLEE